MILTKKEAEYLIMSLYGQFKEAHNFVLKADDLIEEADDFREMRSYVFHHLPTDKLYCIDYSCGDFCGIDIHETDGKWLHEVEPYTITSIGYRRKECEEKLPTSSQE